MPRRACAAKNAVTYGPYGTRFACVCVSVTMFSATTGVSGDVIALFSSTFVFVYTCTSYAYCEKLSPAEMETFRIYGFT